MDTTHLLATDLEVDAALADPTVPLAARAAWQLLRESNLRSHEVLALGVPDAEPDDRRGVIRHSKKGDVFETGIPAAAAGALRELIGTRSEGPLFTVNGHRLHGTKLVDAFRAATAGRTLHARRFTRRQRELYQARCGVTAGQAKEKTV